MKNRANRSNSPKIGRNDRSIRCRAEVRSRACARVRTVRSGGVSFNLENVAIERAAAIRSIACALSMVRFDTHANEIRPYKRGSNPSAVFLSMRSRQRAVNGDSAFRSRINLVRVLGQTVPNEGNPYCCGLRTRPTQTPLTPPRSRTTPRS